MKLSNSSPVPLWHRFSILLPPLLLGVVFVIFAFHGFGGAFPPGLNHDAAWHGLYALRILNGVPPSVYIPESYGHETPYYYVMAAIFAAMGASKESIELTATLFGALSVALFYAIMARKSGHAPTALACGCLWVSSSALILFSRVGWQLVSLLPAALGVCGACRFYLDDARSMRLRPRFWAGAIGLTSAFTLYTYNGGRAILAFVPLFWLLRLLQVRLEPRRAAETSTLRATAQDAAWSLGMFLIVCAPMLQYAAFHWLEWNGRAASLLGESGGWNAKIANLVASLGFFNFSARGDDFFTNFPVLEGPMLALWIAGVAFACLRLRSYWPELLLFGIFLLPGVVTRPSFHRAVGTLPVIYVLVGYLLIATQRRMRNHWGEKRGGWGFGALLAILVALQIGAGWKKLYRDKQPFAWGFYPETTVVGHYLHAHPEQKFVIYAGNWPKDALIFLATTDRTRPGENFSNYQGYNTASGDGLPEITLDLENGILARPAHFVVDSAKTDAFLQALRAKYRVQDEGELRREGALVARLFKVE